ncbi:MULTISPECIES: hypothetical protein [Rhodococcus]|uniref:Uncharacterized protein n=1 Tax=Rhodococcus opacus RKJ300 = JCM 13270 TaxID=1165867 RepID=I0WRZ0_RHOOP|nr:MULTISPECIES: hypothetical protein [Rhodococcus]EID79156.1 hypothetical protein W59_15031 [Rhodococcus opacus RKJ300 = JCM 13270]QQZ17268.1 hypothetical protein GO592_14830 [Rhodococcus sp. 21391]
MTSTNPATHSNTGSNTGAVASGPRAHLDSRRSTETKAAFKTTEFFVYIAAVIGVFIASYLVQTTDAHEDYFRADRAWFYIVILTIAYIVSRGIAKSGCREHYTDTDRHNGV